MQIENFDLTPFIVLAGLVAKKSVRKPRALWKPCQNCIDELNNLGDKLDQFVANVPRGSALFDGLARALRTAKFTDFKFERGAQLFSEVGSVKKSIRRIPEGTARTADFELIISFSNILQQTAQKLQQAA